MPELQIKNFLITRGANQGIQLVLRSYAPGDEDECLRFMEATAEESTHTLKYVGMAPMFAEQLRKLWAEYRAHKVNFNLAAFDGSRIVGHIRGFQRNTQRP